MKLIVSSKLVIFFEIQTIPQSLILRTSWELRKQLCTRDSETIRIDYQSTNWVLLCGKNQRERERESERIFESISKFLKPCYAFYKKRKSRIFNKFDLNFQVIFRPKSFFHLRSFARFDSSKISLFHIFYTHEIIFFILYCMFTEFPRISFPPRNFVIRTAYIRLVRRQKANKLKHSFYAVCSNQCVL